jgi:hypothetical protein
MRLQGWSDERKREGGETSIINDDKGEADNTTTTVMVMIGREAVAVASARGTAV